MEGKGRQLKLITFLYVECGPVPEAKWMTIPDMGYVIVSRYNVALVHLSRLQSWIFFSLRSFTSVASCLIAIGFVHGNHFM